MWEICTKCGKSWYIYLIGVTWRDKACMSVWDGESAWAVCMGLNLNFKVSRQNESPYGIRRR